jgi:hypothetical protein
MKRLAKKPTLKQRLEMAQDAYADVLGEVVRLKGAVLKLVQDKDILAGENSALKRRLELAVEVDVSPAVEVYSYEARMFDPRTGGFTLKLSEEVGE